MIARIPQPPSGVKIKAVYISFEFGLQRLARGDARIARVTCILGLFGHASKNKSVVFV